MIYEMFSLSFLRSATVPPLGRYVDYPSRIYTKGSNLQTHRLNRSIENNQKAFEAIIAAVPGIF